MRNMYKQQRESKSKEKLGGGGQHKEQIYKGKKNKIELTQYDGETARGKKITLFINRKRTGPPQKGI